ncbi:hypothetical protein DN53_13090 [Flagellimonas olearia]|uniref:Dual OB-containing domain-containing protein n=2 Tax=Flagellimonas olearia TaxID=552546 RepID=A0A444VLW2_9FLAO|nr:hypothetical protein DN53_13090 [Allomuricauda olearia]
MNGRSCVGGMTMDGRYVRLLDSNGDNQPEDTDLEPMQAWDIKFRIKPNTTPPHVEDVLVLERTRKRMLKKGITILEFIEKRDIPIWRGHPDNIFDGLIQWTGNGSGFIDRDGGVPTHSVGFWLTDRRLLRRDYNGVRYRYPSVNGNRSLKFKGFQEPVDAIPAGTLLRISLARWVSFSPDEERKCWLQLSGWYDL